MSFANVGGVVWILLGIGLIGYWADRNFYHPTTEDRKFWIKVAEYGGHDALVGKPPASIYFMLGVAAMAYGGHVAKK